MPQGSTVLCRGGTFKVRQPGAWGGGRSGAPAVAGLCEMRMRGARGIRRGGACSRIGGVHATSILFSRMLAEYCGVTSRRAQKHITDVSLRLKPDASELAGVPSA